MSISSNPEGTRTYGPLYTIQDNPPALAAKSLDELLTPDIKFVRVQWIDLINTTRYRVLPVSYFRRLYADPNSRAGISLSKVVFGIVGLQTAPGFGAVGEYLYVPDLGSWRVCTYAPGHASVMGWFQENAPLPGKGLTVDLCPRTILRRIEREAQEKAGVSFLIGVESEFILMSATAPEPVFVNHADWSAAAKTRTGSVESLVLEEIAQCLLDAGVELQMYHAESAPGQYEVVTGPLTPLAAADTLVFTRETIYNVANKHGLRATFAPRLHTDSCGNGAHAHVSVHGPPTAPRAADAACAPTLTPTERSFLQGILGHLPGICALTLPTAASYARVVDGIWSGGTYACWGTSNREVPVRLCGPPGHRHFEVKSVDATATPHLAIAALLGSGLKSILDGALLGVSDCPKPVPEMTTEERVMLGVSSALRLPKTITDARKALAADEHLNSVLGEEFVDTYIRVNETLEKFMRGKNEKDTVRKLIEYF
ncbi:FLU1-II [Trametes meyenii]|nr:FLU1-II [Trametes meyenii]